MHTLFQGISQINITFFFSSFFGIPPTFLSTKGVMNAMMTFPGDFFLQLQLPYDLDLPSFFLENQHKGKKRYFSFWRPIFLIFKYTFDSGVIPHVMSCVVHSAWKDGLITVDYFNDRLRHVFGMVKVDKKNKPCEINQFLAPGKGFSPKFSAAQMWALFRYLPLMISSVFIQEKKYWKLFLQLQEIVDILTGPRIDDATLNYYEIIYAEFLTL